MHAGGSRARPPSGLGRGSPSGSVEAPALLVEGIAFDADGGPVDSTYVRATAPVFTEREVDRPIRSATTRPWQ